MQELLRAISNSYNDFSSGQKKVGDLFFQEPIFLAFSSALEVGKRVNVSESTVIRWTQKLGYKGYTEFQQVLQRKLAEEHFGQTEQKTAEPASQTFLENLLDADIANLIKLKQTIDEELLLRVVDAIGCAKQLYVTSNFLDYGLTHWFSTWLNTALDHTEMLMPSDMQFFSRLAKLKTGDTVIAFAFPRHTKPLFETLKTAKERGAEVIVFTDSADSPAAVYADISIPIFMDSNLNIESYTAVHALLASVLRFVYVKEHEKVKGNFSRLESIYQKKDIFF
ncbi:MurR/RpiR family transcriptional regulator [Planomicrobium sp. CPCC 101079]|uniref:MurR/RpiR family transcriptional regulator n=1 Tax=Planomicrobium sp. CPCC 101079 TaxID=2599618 RepID=UPI0011B67564|nr:MurR/RpiR family transcriptional regulator [Planomicrobium sp. CPCC 101079]TWT15999.1 MurR/RpiR family transcriptional regulator [Planomicrobium sp. CPCC 101079]